MSRPRPTLRDLALAATPSRLASKSPLDTFFAPGSARRKELEEYLTTLRSRGIRVTAVQVYYDMQSSYVGFPVAGDSVRRWLTKHYPNLLPWK